MGISYEFAAPVGETMAAVAIISASIAALSFVFGLYKYLDQRRREERYKRLELYDSLVRRASAIGPSSGEGLPLAQQIAALHELQLFPEYARVTVRILEDLNRWYEQGNANPPVPPALEEAMTEAIALARTQMVPN